MKKTDKKIDNAIRQTLTEVCDLALEKINGFQWLTHQVNYDNFPKSLTVVCVLDTNEQLLAVKQRGDDVYLRKVIKQHLATVNVNITDTHKQVQFDCEEECTRVHNGNWSVRLQS
jgi:hypothetical protein